jgi:Protein of unknown function (DUF3489)
LAGLQAVQALASGRCSSTEVIMSNTELENAKVSEAQPGPKDRKTERRSLSPLAKSHQSKRSSTRRHARSRSKKQRRATRVATKQDLVIQMLARQSGASVDEIAGKTGWQTHSVRGFLSAVVRKKLGLTLVSEAGKDGARRYHVAVASSKA